MSNKPERIAAKLAHMEYQIDTLRGSDKAVAYVGGGSLPCTRDEEITFQERCRAELAWAQGKTDAEVRTRIKEIEKDLRPGILARKYGDMRGLSLDAVEAIRKIELLEVALGTHPGLGKGSTK